MCIRSYVRTVDSEGNINTLAGNGNGSFSGDGGPATAAGLFSPTGILLNEASGDVYIAGQWSSACSETRILP